MLIGPFGFGALEAVILNKAVSLVVVSSSLLFRSRTIPFGEMFDHWFIIANLLAGSLLGAWIGASWATQLAGKHRYRVIAVLLVGIAVVLLVGHGAESREPLFGGISNVIAGIIAGFAIGVVASLLGVAGGELLIPTIILLFGADVKLAGSLSLAVSLPTMLVGFVRYSRDRSFAVLGRNRTFLVLMAAGSLVGALLGGLLLGVVPATILLPLLAAVLIVSSYRVWRRG